MGEKCTISTRVYNSSESAKLELDSPGESAVLNRDSTCPIHLNRKFESMLFRCNQVGEIEIDI